MFLMSLFVVVGRICIFIGMLWVFLVFWGGIGFEKGGYGVGMSIVGRVEEVLIVVELVEFIFLIEYLVFLEVLGWDLKNKGFVKI